jgi:O-antigen/teichoic acid export membrane protein
MILKLLKERSILSTLGISLGALFNALAIYFIAHGNDKSELGQWLFFIACAFIFEHLCRGLLRTALVWHLSETDDQKQRDAIIGSSWFIGIIFTLGVVIINYSILLCVPALLNSVFCYFLKWNPLLMIASLPISYCLAILQEKQKFGSILVIFVLRLGGFAIFNFINNLFFKLTIESIIIYYIIISATTSFVGIILGWSGIHTLFQSKKELVIKLLNYGKYCMGTSVASDILRSSDTLIITLMLSTEDAALYGIPLKLIEALSIPIIGLSFVAFPQMSKAFGSNRTGKKVAEIFYKYTSILILMFIPLLIFMLIFSKELILFFGGLQYIKTNTAINVFRIFLMYGLILPIDRLTGTALDSINKPKKTFYKVLFMVIANIIGDIAVLFIFRRLEAVAVITILNIVIGSVLGVIYLEEINIEVKQIPIYAKNILKQTFNRYVIPLFQKK